MNNEESKILVNLIDIETDHKIKGYWTTNFSETLKMYNYALEAGIYLEIGFVDNPIEDKYAENIFAIKNIRVRFGDNINLTCINVYVEVF